jgi:hypothetical protein
MSLLRLWVYNYLQYERVEESLCLDICYLLNVINSRCEDEVIIVDPNISQVRLVMEWSAPTSLGSNNRCEFSYMIFIFEIFKETVPL